MVNEEINTVHRRIIDIQSYCVRRALHAFQIQTKIIQSLDFVYFEIKTKKSAVLEGKKSGEKGS